MGTPLEYESMGTGCLLGNWKEMGDHGPAGMTTEECADTCRSYSCRMFSTRGKKCRITSSPGYRRCGGSETVYQSFDFMTTGGTKCEPNGEIACYRAAKALGLKLGKASAGYPFIGPDYGTKGCYAYTSGSWSGYAFFGAGGSASQNAASPGSGKYRPSVYNTCSGDETELDTEAEVAQYTYSQKEIDCFASGGEWVGTWCSYHSSEAEESALAMLKSTDKHSLAINGFALLGLGALLYGAGMFYCKNCKKEYSHINTSMDL